MEAPAVCSGDTLYLVHSSGLKFWEITVVDRGNHIRYGKLREGIEEEVESGSSTFSSQTEALDRAKTLVRAKIERDYHVLVEEGKESGKEPSSEFARIVLQSTVTGGTYMELCEGSYTSYWKVQVQGEGYVGSQVRVEKGVKGGRPASWVNTYVNDDEAVRAGKAEVRDKLARGFKRCEEKPIKPQAMEIDLEAIPQTPPMSPATPVVIPKVTSDLGQVLVGTGLERYLPVLEAEGVSIDELGIMTEDDFQRLGIPRGVSGRLKECILRQSPVTDKRKHVEDIPLSSTSKKPKLTPELKPVDLMRSFPWDDSINPQGWLMTEEVAGLRCLWTGQELIQSSGNVLPAPMFFIQGLPIDTKIDVVLVVGKGDGKKTVTLTRKGDGEIWKETKLVVLDLPGLRKPLEERVTCVGDLVTVLQLPHLVTPNYELCRDIDHLQETLRTVLLKGGQGLTLRQPGSFYENKRSKSFLSVRPTLTGEATVHNYEPGRGRLEGLVAALVVKAESGLEFRIQAGLPEDLRRNPPALGSKVRFQYQEHSASGAPKCPVYLP